jgi:hypothetical protein
VIATVLLLWATPASACCSQCYSVIFAASALAIGSLGSTTLCQLGLMGLYRREPFSKLSVLGWWTLGGLSSVNVLAGVAALWVGINGEAIIFSSVALALLALGLSGLKMLR